MTRHFIPLPRSAVISPTHTTPRFETVSLPACYQNVNDAVGIAEFLSLIYGVPDYISTIQAQGFVQLPTALVGVIRNNILNNNNGFNIDIEDASVCEAAGGSTYVGR